MKQVTMAQELHLGIEVIDEQHSRFFELINRMLLRDPQGDPLFLAGEILDELSDYVYEHFKTEENLMEEHNFPGLGGHRRQHAEFVAQYIEFNRRLRQQEHGLEDQIMVFLVGWLTAHIRQEDRKYADFLVLGQT